MKHVIIFFSLCQLLIFAVSVSTAAPSSRHTFATISFDVGYGTLQDTQHDLTATRFAAGVLYNHHDFRFAYTSLSFAEAGPPSGGGPDRGGANAEIAVFYGWRVVDGRHGYVCPSTGLAWAHVHRRAAIAPYADNEGIEHDYENRSYDLIALPLNLQAVWKLSRHFGLGAEWYADINRQNTFSGLVFGVYWDRL